MRNRLILLFSLFLVIALLFGGRILSAPTAIAESAPLKSGDANGDGKLDVSDAALILRYLAGLVTLSSEQLAAADADGTGGVTAADAALILRHVAGLAVIPGWVEELPLYNPGDIAVINTMIDNNGLDWPKADPADGTYMPEEWESHISWSWEGIQMRIHGLNIGYMNIAGPLDVSGLAALQWLYCFGNQLTGLHLSGLTELYLLDCSNNQLTELNLYGLTALQYLRCGYNQLTSLDPSDCTALQSLECVYNQLTTLALRSTATYDSLDVRWNRFSNKTQITGFDPALWDNEWRYMYYPQNP